MSNPEAAHNAMPNFIGFASQAILYEVPKEEIRTNLIEMGLNDYNAWLTYHAASVLNRMRDRLDWEGKL